MTFAPEKIPAAARHELIAVGRKFGSEDTLAQAEQTLKALKTHGPKFALWGFNDADTKSLDDARAALITAGVGREVVRVDKKTTNTAYADALKTGKAKRLRARSVLSGARRVLDEQGDAESVRTIDTVLDHAPTAGDSAGKVAEQLDTLLTTFSEASVAKAASERGGPEIVVELVTCSAALRAVSQDAATVPGTPAATERLNLIDGIIVGLTRDARKAARAAAKELGEPAMAAEFELTHLYGSGKGKKPAVPAPAPAPENPEQSKAPAAGG
jgi:hypothetical protein